VNDMSVTCVDRERIFMDGSAKEWTALEAHAATCAECGEEVRAWKSMSVAASELKQEWETPYLWSKIERSLTERSAEKPSRVRGWLNLIERARLQWQTVAALVLVIVVTATVFVTKPWSARDQDPHFLQNSAMNEVERTEAAYQRAIDKLDAQAQPQLEVPSPLMASYREKLLVLDNAIAELREQAGQNPANAYLRRQLLAMYQEKQETLQEVLETKR